MRGRCQFIQPRAPFSSFRARAPARFAIAPRRPSLPVNRIHIARWETRTWSLVITKNPRSFPAKIARPLPLAEIPKPKT